jgi:serine protease Do
MDSLEVRKRPNIGILLIILVVLANLCIGLFGGVVGFVVLTNSKSTAIHNLRSRLGIDGNSSLAIPIQQNVRVEESSAIIDAAKKVSPAVVSISASQQVQDFFGQTSNQEVAGGTGFILTSDGLILTNKHVVSLAASYKVVLSDGRIFDAKIQAIDPSNDIAVVKIDAKDLPTVEIGTSDALQIGQYVLAVGNALGEFKNSVTLGVVSAKQRSISAAESGNSSTGGEQLTGLIQTDAAINPGNSGGPMVNLAGQVVGINTAIASTTGGSIGVGFAIPIDSVKSVIDSVRKTGQIIRPYLGVRYVGVDKSLQQINKLSVDYGALVSRGQTAGEVAVIPGSPADQAGIVENDIILEVNGERIDTDNPLSKRLQKYQPGDEVTIKLQHAGQEKTVKVKLIKNPA